MWIDGIFGYSKTFCNFRNRIFYVKDVSYHMITSSSHQNSNMLHGREQRSSSFVELVQKQKSKVALYMFLGQIRYPFDAITAKSFSLFTGFFL